MIARHPCGTRRVPLPLLPSGPGGVRGISLRRTRLSKWSLACGGEGGIRTHGALLTHTRFPIVPLRPLGHLSVSLLKNWFNFIPKFCYCQAYPLFIVWKKIQEDAAGPVKMLHESRLQACRLMFIPLFPAWRQQQKAKNGGEGGIRTHGTLLGVQTISSRPRYDRFGTSPCLISCAPAQEFFYEITRSKISKMYQIRMGEARKSIYIIKGGMAWFPGQELWP